MPSALHSALTCPTLCLPCPSVALSLDLSSALFCHQPCPVLPCLLLCPALPCPMSCLLLCHVIPCPQSCPSPQPCHATTLPFR
jgi:hypothetical protein